ncbi:Hypothetical predicted protein [Cloeon dipterum]|uniref:Uncharacterized protein n=1 Tax=Cloeon dipterum TaxID=197152 RepID=A0A8S1DUF4_9INSE|nr:Hypothetical predicted protein [Cloeon dipterum]
MCRLAGSARCPLSERVRSRVPPHSLLDKQVSFRPESYQVRPSTLPVGRSRCTILHGVASTMPKSPQAGSSEDGGASVAAASPNSAPRKTYRGLASQIVTHDEIAQEIMHRSLRKNPPPIQSEVKDVFFAMKLTQRLANKLSPAAKDGAFMPPPMVSHEPPPLMRLDQETTSSPHVLVLPKRKASVEAPPAPTTPPAPPKAAPKAATPATPKAGGTPKAASGGRKGFRFQKNMDPEVERELALKQLNELPTLKRSRRKTKEVVAPPSKTQEASIQTSALQHPLTNGDAPKLEPKQDAEKAESVCSSESKKRRSMHRELDMLLGDEGAVNMIYEAERGQERRKARPQRPDLSLKARLVKTAVIRLSSAPASQGPRARRKTEPTRPPMEPPAPKATPKLEPASPRPTAEESRIIRRHSTSSSDSDVSPSPPTKRKNIPIFIKKADKSQPRPRKTPANVFPAVKKSQKIQPKIVESKIRIQLKKKPDPRKKMSAAVKRSLKTVMAKNFQQGLVKKTQITAPLKAKVKSETEDDPTLRSLEAKLAMMIGEDPAPESPKTAAGSSSSTTGKPSGLSSKRSSTDDSGKQRSTFRQNAGVISCKELTVRRHPNFIQIILNPSSTKFKNSFNTAVLRELKNILVQLKKDESCRVLLLSSNGPAFCQGVDLHSLNVLTQEKRKKAAQELALAIKEFSKAMAAFSKPIVAAVNGSAVGLGVAMLPLCDLVLASDKATFFMPYADLGQSLEGGASITFPRLSGSLASDLLYSGRKITSMEAERIGLVTRVVWHDNYLEHLMPTVQELASKSLQSLESTKNLLRESLRRELDSVLEAEEKLQVQHWCSSEFQKSVRKFLESEGLHLQKGSS